MTLPLDNAVSRRRLVSLATIIAAVLLGVVLATLTLLHGGWVCVSGTGRWYTCVPEGGTEPPWVPLSTLAAMPSAILTWYWRHTQKERDQQHAVETLVTTRFREAAKLLSDPATVVPALYELERIADDSERDAATVVRTVAAWVRAVAPARRPPMTVPVGDQYHGETALEPANSTEFPNDPGSRFKVQTAIEVLGSIRSKHPDVEPPKLAGVDLAATRLYRVRLDGADLAGANLMGTHLELGNLNGAKLQRADLQRADLFLADLLLADLQGANLQGADLRGAKLNGAKLDGADLQDADLQGAELTGANLKNANLKGASMHPGQAEYARSRGAILDHDARRRRPER